MKPAGGKIWFTAAELAELALPGLPKSKRKINEDHATDWALRVDRDGIPFARPRAARGGGMEYHVDVLPVAARVTDAPTFVAKADAAVRKLQADVVELGKKKPPNFQSLIDQSKAAIGVIQGAKFKPFDDFVQSQQDSLEILQLQAAGLDDQAAALKIIQGLEKTLPPLDDARKAGVLATVEALKAEQRQIDINHEHATLYTNALGGIKTVVQDATQAFVRGDLGQLIKSPGKLLDAFTSLEGQQGFEKLFGSVFRDLQDQINGTSVVRDASERMADAVNLVSQQTNVTTAALDRLGKASNAAADAVSGASAVPADVGGSPIDANGDVVVTGKRTAANPVTRDPVALFSTAIGSLATEIAGVFTNPSIAKSIGSSIGKYAGEGLKGAATGTLVAGIGKSLGIDLSTGGSQAGGALGGVLGSIKGVTSALGPFGAALTPVLSVFGGLVGKLFASSKTGSATIGAVNGEAGVTGTSGNNSTYKADASSAGDAVADSINQIVEQLGGSLGSFAVSIGKKNDKYVVDNSGSGSTAYGKANDGITAYSTLEEAQAAALKNAIADGAVTGLSAAVQKAFASSTDVDKALREALKVQDVELTIGGIGAQLITRGLVLETSVNRGVLTIGLADQAADLKRPLLVDRFAGTGGIEGPTEFADQIKPRAWGRCFNVPGRQIDAAVNIWCFGDPLRQWRSFDQVRDMGVAASPAALTLLAWQGTVEATLNALRATAAIEGGGVLCPSIACVKWWTTPAGDLHADIRGETEGGYVETAPEIVARIVAARSGIPFAAGAIAAATSARPEPFGWFVDNDTATAAAEISEILGGVSTSWLLIGGEIAFRPWDWGASTRIARSFAVTRKSTVKPTGSRKLGYRRNWSPMARGDLAAIVLSMDVLYEDGTPIENLKPAQPGADVTGDNTSKDTNAVGGTPAHSVLDSITLNSFNTANLAAQTEAARLRDRALLFLGPNGEDAFTLINREETQRKDADGVFVEDFALLGARTADGLGYVLNTGTVKIGPTETLAQRFDEISGTFDDNAASINHIDQVLVGPGGATARSLNVVDVNGRIVGNATTNDGLVGSVVFAADNFRIEDPDSGEPYFYADDTGKVLMHDVEVDTLKYGSMDPEFIARQLTFDGSEGTQVLPGGVIMKWGRYRGRIADEVTLSVVFVAPFPSACDTFIPTPYLATFSIERDLWLQNVGEPTRFGGTIATQAGTKNNQNLDGFNWLAFGR